MLIALWIVENLFVKDGVTRGYAVVFFDTGCEDDCFIKRSTGIMKWAVDT